MARSRPALWMRTVGVVPWLGLAGPLGRLALVGVTTLALVHQQLDLSTYLLGGAHAASNDLFAGPTPPTISDSPTSPSWCCRSLPVRTSRSCL